MPRRRRHRSAPPTAPPAPVAVSVAAVESRPIDRYLRVTGSLIADEQAEVSAETAGRVDRDAGRARARASRQGTLLAPHLRHRDFGAAAGSRGERGADRVAPRARAPDQPFDAKQVPDVMNAKASLDCAEAEFDRIRSLLDQKVVSQSESDQRRTQVEAARQQYQVALNSAAAVLPLARGGARAHRAGPQGGRRHRRPGAVRRPGRRARR